MSLSETPVSSNNMMDPQREGYQAPDGQDAVACHLYLDNKKDDGEEYQYDARIVYGQSLKGKKARIREIAPMTPGKIAPGLASSK